MEAQNDPKPKRKYVMTPEHRAKVLANLAQARLAPKEKVYRKTPKRYAANLNNLGIAAAKRREEAETLHAKMEELFPPPEVPMPSLASIAQSPSHPLHRMPPSFFLDPFEEATRLIGKRLRKVHAGVRREGRRIMRLLTAALHRSQPLSAEEARNLACQLLKCLDGTRVGEEARRLNDKIARLLRKMIETRYGLGPGEDALEIWLEQMREERRARAAAARERREARRAQKAQEAQEVGKGHPVTTGDPAEAPPGARVGVGPVVVGESGNENGGGFEEQGKEPRRVSIPELPETYEEFQSLVTRALDVEDEPEVGEAVAFSIWLRLHIWQHQGLVETQWMERFIQKEAANSLDSYPDPYQELRDRAGKIPLILELDKDFLRWMDRLTKDVASTLDRWVSTIPWVERPWASPPVEFPAQLPVSAASDGPARGSEDMSSVA